MLRSTVSEDVTLWLGKRHSAVSIVHSAVFMNNSINHILFAAVHGALTLRFRDYQQDRERVSFSKLQESCASAQNTVIKIM